MRPLFPRWSTHAFRAGLAVAAVVAIAAPSLAMAVVRSPYGTGENQPTEQPVAFDHRHHVVDDGIDCRYCHGGAERSAYAGVPATSVCMGCHAQIWSDSPSLAVVRASMATSTPIHWRRVTGVPDFVYFNHRTHIDRGVGCVDCHGRVDRMARVEQAQPMTMGWCLDCHRHPEGHLRPQSRITDMTWKPGDGGPSQVALVEALHPVPPVDCSGCHR